MGHKRKSATRDRDYRGYYTDASAQLVADYFAQDVRILGYRFEDPASLTQLSDTTG
jgi:hypothetical protein